MKRVLKFLFFLALNFMFFPQFVLYIVGGTNGNVKISLIFCVSLYIALLFINRFKIKKLLTRIIKLPVFKYYALYAAFVTLTTIGHILIGRYTAPTYFYCIRMYKYYYAITLVYFFPLLIYILKVNIRTVIKYIYSIIYFLIIVCIIQYFAFLFRITPLISLIDIFSNGRDALYGDASACSSLLRVYGFFGEPSGLGQFIFIIMPFIYNISTSNLKLYKNKIIDNIIRYSFLPMLLFVIIFTKSPIYIILCFIEFGILLTISNIHHIKKNFGFICFFSGLVLLIITLFIHLEPAFTQHSVISRIQTTFHYITDFHSLARKESSLATRIVSYYMQFKVFLRNCIFGCGLFNAEIDVNGYYMQEAKIPITPENYYMQYLRLPFMAAMNKSIIWTSLAEFGIIGFFLYILFVVKSFIFSKKIVNIFLGIERIGLISVSQCYITIFIISFYNINYFNEIVWLIYGLLLMYLYAAKYKSYKIVRINKEDEKLRSPDN